LAVTSQWISSPYCWFVTDYYAHMPLKDVSQVCGKALVGQSWHVHHCVQEKDDALHGQSHSCPCGHEWTYEEQLTLTPYLKVFAKSG
jgi:hypothetical protein